MKIMFPYFDGIEEFNDKNGKTEYSEQGMKDLAHIFTEIRKESCFAGIGEINPEYKNAPQAFYEAVYGGKHFYIIGILSKHNPNDEPMPGLSLSIDGWKILILSYVPESNHTMQSFGKAQRGRVELMAIRNEV